MSEIQKIITVIGEDRIGSEVLISINIPKDWKKDELLYSSLISSVSEKLALAFFAPKRKSAPSELQARR